jgi:hypothetical protein
MKNKIIRYKFLVCISFVLSALSIQAQIDSGVPFDLQGYINQKISEGETNIVVPPGRYRISPNGNYHLRFDDLNDITIVADSVEMICTETVQAIKINNCTNFKLKGLTIDYDPLPFTQARIVEMSSDKNTLTADFIEGYSTTIRGDKLEIFDSETGELSTTTYYGTTYQIDHQQRRIVITKRSNYNVANSHEEIGDIAVFGSQNTKHIPHAIVPNECSGLVIEDVTLYAGTTFGFFETNCSGSQYINCKVDRRPLTTEIVERSVRRMRSINADGFHSKYATVGPKYIGCLARYNGDDGIAINGHYHIIAATDGNQLTVVPKGGNNLNLSVGDTAELVSYTGERIEDAVINEISTGPAPSSTIKVFLQNQTFHGAADNTYQASNVYYVTLNRAVNLPMGSLIASANKIGNGFEVRNCTMGPNRSRGIIIKASNGVITDNNLVSNWGQAIKLAPEYSWLEAGSGSNITISGNTITKCHDAAIAVYAYGGNGETAPAGAHKNIIISGNNISGSTNPAIAVTSVKGLELKNNTIESPNNDYLVPWRMQNFGRSEDPWREIYLENVEDLAVGIDDKETNQSFGMKINMNPFSEELVLKFTKPINVPFSIYDMLGRKVFSSATGLTININTSDWNKGLYILAIEGETPVKLLKN